MSPTFSTSTKTRSFTYPVAQSLDSATSSTMRRNNKKGGYARYSVLSPPMKRGARSKLNLNIDVPDGGPQAPGFGVAQSLTSMPTNRKRGVCGTPVEEINTQEGNKGRFFVEGLSPDNFESDIQLRASSSDLLNDSAEDSGRARSKSRIFSPKTTADMVEKSKGEKRGDDKEEEEEEDKVETGISPPPCTARSLSASNVFDSFIPPMPRSPATPEEAIMDLGTTTKEGVKFVMKAIKQERKKHKKTAMNPKAHLMVVPPISWKEGGQKASFIEWGCNPLVGFGLRNAGGGVVFLQLQLAKMDQLYGTLEGVLKEMRRKEKESKEGAPEPVQRVRRRSLTYPSNVRDQRQQPPVPAYDPVNDAMDLVTEGISDMRVDGGAPTPAGGTGRIRKGPRPSYSPTPTMNVNMNPMSDYVVRRRRLSSPPPNTAERCGGSPVFKPCVPQPGSGPGFSATDTPMVKRVYWGSQPLSANRDWGGSEKAEGRDIERMNKFLEDMGETLGGGEGMEEVRQPGALARRCSGEKRGSGMAMLVRSNTLTFDDEVEETGRTPGRRDTDNTESTEDMEEDTDEAAEDEDEEEDAFDAFGGDGFDDEPLQPLGGFGGIGGERLSKFGKDKRRSSSMFGKRESLGDGGMGGLSLLGDGVDGAEKEEEKRRKTLAKHRRVSMSVNALEIAGEGAGKGRESWLGGMVGRMSGVGMIRSRISSIGGGLLGKFGIARRSVEVAQKSVLARAVGRARQEALKVGLVRILGYLNESELMTQSCLVNREWWDASVGCHASLMLVSVGCEDKEEGKGGLDEEYDSELDSDNEEEQEMEEDGEDGAAMGSVAESMVKSWKWMGGMYPWGNFLSEGAFKRVYKVWNHAVGDVEAVSVMDLDLIESTGNKQVVGAELAVSVLLSSLVRRNICPNFIATRRTFTCTYEPPSTHWGSESNKAPKGKRYNGKKGQWPKERGRAKGRYQYIAMELCKEGDIEEYIKRQPDMR